MHRVATAATAELFELEPIRRVLFILRRHVVAFLALRALQNDVISRHYLPCKSDAFRRSFVELFDVGQRVNASL